MIRLSKPSKMPCQSWSLEALVTCPASKKPNGELVDACKGCYATSGNYRYPNVKAPRASNKIDWRRSAWVSDMVQELDTERYFRWFDSGDVYAHGLAVKIYEVMKLTPWAKHWLPTRMHKLAKFTSILAKMESLPNVSVRRSSDSVLGEYSSIHGSTIIPEGTTAPKGVTVCKSSTTGGKCITCRACWDKSIPVIGYISHGRSMKKVIRIASQV